MFNTKLNLCTHAHKQEIGKTDIFLLHFVTRNALAVKTFQTGTLNTLFHFTVQCSAMQFNAMH